MSTNNIAEIQISYSSHITKDDRVKIMGIVIVAGHNLIDVFSVNKKMFVFGGEITLDFFWYLFHQQGGMQIGETHHYLQASYPMLPWLGIMILGYCVGRLYSKEINPKIRFKYLLTICSSMLLLFIVLRTFNLYGDPQWVFENQDSFFKSIVSFLRITKYPPFFPFYIGYHRSLLNFLGSIGKSEKPGYKLSTRFWKSSSFLLFCAYCNYSCFQHASKTIIW